MERPVTNTIHVCCGSCCRTSLSTPLSPKAEENTDAYFNGAHHPIKNVLPGKRNRGQRREPWCLKSWAVSSPTLCPSPLTACMSCHPTEPSSHQPQTHTSCLRRAHSLRLECSSLSNKSLSLLHPQLEYHISWQASLRIPKEGFWPFF